MVLALIFSSPLFSTETVVLATIKGKTFVDSNEFKGELDRISPHKKKLFTEEMKKEVLEAIVAKKLITMEVRKRKYDLSPEFVAEYSNLEREEILKYFVRKLQKEHRVTDEVEIEKFYRKHGAILFPSQTLDECRNKIVKRLTDKKLKKILSTLYEDFIKNDPPQTGEISLFFQKCSSTLPNNLANEPIYKFKTMEDINFAKLYGMIVFFKKKGNKIDLTKKSQQNFFLEKILKDCVMEHIARSNGLTIQEPLHSNLKRLKEIACNLWYLKHKLESKKVTDKDIHDFYEKNRRNFTTPTMVNVDLIEVADEKKGEEALRKLKTGYDFCRLAGEISIHKSKVKNGKLGYIVPNLKDMDFLGPALLNLKKGQISSLIRGRNGFFIVRLNDIKKEYTPPIEKLRDKISYILSKKNEIDGRKKLGKRLMESYGVTIFFDNLKKVSLE
jgi:parvulin-like peptidyl-prolyl isomerase